MPSSIYALLADLVLAVHFGVVVFVVAGLVLIVAGNRWGWRFVNGWWFRLAHLVAIAIVVVQAWLGVACPLTTLESSLRARARESVYEASFVEHWLERALYYDLPAWVFTLGYTLFGCAVLVAWWRFPPQRRRQR
jgi:hypothetical protein